MTKSTVTRSEIIEKLVEQQPHLGSRDVELAVKTILDQLGTALVNGERIEIRGFGSFSLHYRPARIGRNPKTGESVSVGDKFSPHFKPGKELKDRVDTVST